MELDSDVKRVFDKMKEDGKIDKDLILEPDMSPINLSKMYFISLGKIWTTIKFTRAVQLILLSKSPVSLDLAIANRILTANAILKPEVKE